MATVKAHSYSVAAATVIALILWAWGTGENGDLGFAALCAAVALAAFAVGTLVRSWWIVLCVAAIWFCGWTLFGELAAPDTYTAITAYFAPGLAIFSALGVGAGRRRSRQLA